MVRVFHGAALGRFARNHRQFGSVPGYSPPPRCIGQMASRSQEQAWDAFGNVAEIRHRAAEPERMQDEAKRKPGAAIPEANAKGTKNLLSM